MANREMLNSEDIEELLTENSKQVIETFLTYYKESSQANMRSSVYRLLYHELSKDDVSEVNFEDYSKIFPDEDKKLSSQESYRLSFFKFLFAFDYMNSPDGFETIWIKDREKRQLEKRKQREARKEDNKPRKTLTIEELLSIQKVIEIDSKKLDTLKMQFCWFAIFELGLDVNEVRLNITSENYLDGKLHTKEGSYTLSGKFHYMFEMLSERDSNHNGFATIDLIIGHLGKLAKLDRKLLPSMIKLTRKSYMVTCSNCGNEYTNLTHNWRSVNNRIVCVNCAETLKKNLNTEVDVSLLENTNIQSVRQEELSILYTYEELKQKLQSKQIDYLKLHEFQIKIGKLGEAYVYEYECKKLIGTKYVNQVDEKKALDPANGYDILSYTREGKPLHIEVKSTAGTEDTFYLSNHELKTAKRMKENGLIYVLYFVKEIMSDSPKLIKIKDITANKDYHFEEMNWKVIKI